MDANLTSSKPNNLKLETLRVLVGDLSDEEKLSLLELIYQPKQELDLSSLDLNHLDVQDLTVGRILFILRDIDMSYRTNFSARIYFTGSCDLLENFDGRASYNEIGVIANCKFVGQVLLRLVRHFYTYPDEEDIEELLSFDKQHFNDISNDYGGISVRNFLEFLSCLETSYISDNILTSEFKTKLYGRRAMETKIYETDISKVDVWTIARLYSELYGEQIYERKVISPLSPQ